MTQSISTNYHSFLGEIKGTFDSVLTIARNQDEHKWKSLAWKAPFLKIKKSFKAIGPLSKLFITISSLIPPGGIIALFSLIPVPLWVSITGGVFLTLLLLFLIYWLMVWLHGGKMASMGNPEFHIGAFKAKRKKEYQMWSPFFQNHNATFGGLYSFVTPLLTSSRDNIDSVVSLAQLQVNSAQDTAERFRSDRDFLQSEVLRYENAVGYLVELVKVINKSLYRLVNGLMNSSEMNFICAFTVYEVEDGLIRKKWDHWTTGASPKTLDLTVENASKYAAVYVAMQSPDEDSFSYNNPFPGRTVASYRMKMLEEKTWVWNFHFDDSNERALKLALSNDIIEVREVYRLVHAFCLLLQKQEIEGREGHDHGIDEASQKAN